MNETYSWPDRHPFAMMALVSFVVWVGIALLPGLWQHDVKSIVAAGGLFVGAWVFFALGVAAGEKYERSKAVGR